MEFSEDQEDGAALAARIAADLPALSPRLKIVAEYCLQRIRHLHLCRIQDIADACDTPPVTVVRLAKHYGFRGFLDFKMAFIVDGEGTAPRVPSLPAMEGWAPQCRAPGSKGTLVQYHARAVMENCRHDMGLLRSDWSGTAFNRAVSLLKGGHTIWMDCAKETTNVANCYADLFRVAGLTVQWVQQPEASHDPRRGQISERDVLLTMSLTPNIAGKSEVVHMAKRMGTPVIAVTDSLDNSLSRAADAHLYVANLGVAMHGVSAGMLLAHAIDSARLAALS
jgi:DNA-binding MurR/RpiR family transcriptional regulator